ncbi:MAG: DUF3179 domain-containing protein [Saprospiraceae bacterium]|nr:DUF3179 domain-containing protein [Saprospiraceae bacterium]
MKTFHILKVALVSLMFLSCSKEDTTLGNRGVVQSPTAGNDWQIPLNEIRDGGPGKDGIPSIDDPQFEPQEAATYMVQSDLVLAISIDGTMHTYTHPILDWHEIVNDRVGDTPLAITYCPLTGTGTAWNRMIGGEETTFGVSGLLYRNNLIPYDRGSDSNWSQISLNCVQGALAGQQVEIYPMVEMGWPLYQRLFPDQDVLSTNTGASRTYGNYPYHDYKTNHDFIIFGRAKQDDRLPTKERVLGVVVDQRAKVFRFDSFSQFGLIQETFGGKDIVVFGSKEDNIMMAYQSLLIDGTSLEFTPLDALEVGGLVMSDQLGNQWNIFGEAVEGPHKGERLRKVTAFMGYWFAFADFFINPSIHVD